jgi:diguanylate cyclase (GGDEF)-like protein
MADVKRRADIHRLPLPSARAGFSSAESANRAAAEQRLRGDTELMAEVERLRTELAAARDQIRRLELAAETDPLLDVLNRRGFERELARTLAYIGRYETTAALIFIDLDGFKTTNDQHGHAAGDAALRGVAVALRGHVRESDVLARIGGDEFAIVLWNVSHEAAQAKATALEDAIANAGIYWDNVRLEVAGSAGATLLSPHESAVDALDRADRLMYARKAARQAMAPQRKSSAARR